MTTRELLIEVRPRVPPRIARLEELANNLWYAWERPARELFGPLDPVLWNHVGHNPKLFLQRVDQRKLERAATDPVFLGRYHEVLSNFDLYLEQRTPQMAAEQLEDGDLVAYFCAEYGLHESMPIYSGGLGVLAGDHCKTASDLRLPFVAVGLLYRAGYFSQEIDGDGNQIARFLESRLEHLPIRRLQRDDGEPVEIAIPLARRMVAAYVWELMAGHTRILLLDTDVPRNAETDRAITYQLYGGGHETRIKQEIVLGIGGVLALDALEVRPTVWHANEGHAAFMVIARTAALMREGLDYAAALEAVAAATVFTTHTPVPAGHDHFAVSLVSDCLQTYVESIGLEWEQFIALGKLRQHDHDFNMTALALRGSRHHNGVSALHGEVSSQICAPAWPEVPANENPVGHVTNGVHVPTFLETRWHDLLERFLGPDWRSRFCDAAFWNGVERIPDHLFWSVRQSIKSAALYSLREALELQYSRNQVSQAHARRLLRYLNPDDPNILTIGFARRFATYKRATLLFRDLGWLEHIMSDPEQPVVFIFAGKAHPADEPGQQLMRQLHRMVNHGPLVGKILLLEGYDVGLARRMVSGVDVWMNTPVYPEEASGTSGMKAAINGVLNLSVTDGWWAEGYDHDNGWAISPSPHKHDPERRDQDDAQTLYETLQDAVLPLYYDRGKSGMSPGWVAMSKRSMASNLPRFNTSRMLNDYIEQFYAPAARVGRRLMHDGARAATALAQWKQRVRAAWPGVGLSLGRSPDSALAFGADLEIEVVCDLHGLQPDDVVVEALMQPAHGGEGAPVGGGYTDMDANPQAELTADAGVQSYAFSPVQVLSSERHLYRLAMTPERCGQMSLRVRVYPSHPNLAHPFEMGMMRFLDEE